MDIDRADMKLLIEAGYSGVLRNIDTDVTPIFDAIDSWLPDNGAGSIGHALQALVAGDYARADDLLQAVIDDRPQGKPEARSILALCKALQNDDVGAERLARELQGEGGAAEEFARLLTEGPDDGVGQRQDAASVSAR